jgi:hypothetical protein
MTLWQAIGLFLAGYILLLARSAWIQGELKQFLLSLAVLAALAGAVALVVLLYSRLAG